jgi:hypothetical protein
MGHSYSFRLSLRSAASRPIRGGARQVEAKSGSQHRDACPDQCHVDANPAFHAATYECFFSISTHPVLSASHVTMHKTEQLRQRIGRYPSSGRAMRPRAAREPPSTVWALGAADRRSIWWPTLRRCHGADRRSRRPLRSSRFALLRVILADSCLRKRVRGTDFNPTDSRESQAHLGRDSGCWLYWGIQPLWTRRDRDV